MINKKISFIILFVIIVLAAVIRLWQLGVVPPSPDWDEASLGYNAYSIMTTGKDEYGKFLPFILRSFDDYKPALYAYFIIPFIKIFGLNILAVRLPSALFGILTVLATYFLVKELLSGKYSGYIALLSSFFLAISPWHIQFSRVAFEAQVGLAFNIFAILFFLKGLKKHLMLLPSVLFAGFSIYIYQSEKVYLPILFAALFIIYRKDILSLPKKWLAGVFILGAIIVLPMFYQLVTNQNVLLRAKGVSVYSDQTQFLKRNAEKYNADKQAKNYLGILVDNRRIEYVKAVVSGYISHWDLNWLFITGDIERHHAPFMGLLYLFELPFLFIGIYQLLFGDFSKKGKLTIFAIFLIAPIPASITSGVPHAVRTINFLPTFQIFVSLGILTTAMFVSRIKYKVLSIKVSYFIFSFGILFFIFNFLYFLNQYFVQQNYYFSQNWQYGYKQAIDFIKPVMKNYDSIVVSNQSPLDQSYIFFLFYLKHDPSLYQKFGGTESGGFKEPHKGFDNITFREIDWKKEEKNEKILYVVRSDDLPSDSHVLKTIYYLDGKPAIKIAE
ncbi:MAG: hypothetical protein AUK12_00580 [Candidatus Levybacteria bacterium CG2_30_37_29]|nr:MAG: hypothetical protein AUK12_00580 [Candidatus Levybacteria bacterium CG2_30_37_29]